MRITVSSSANDMVSITNECADTKPVALAVAQVINRAIATGLDLTTDFNVKVAF